MKSKPFTERGMIIIPIYQKMVRDMFLIAAMMIVILFSIAVYLSTTVHDEYSWLILVAILLYGCICYCYAKAFEFLGEDIE